MITNKNLQTRFRIHALWSLESLKAFDWQLWKKLLLENNKYIKTQALRSLRNLQNNIELTFPTLEKLVKQEKNFSVIKEIINYIGSCKTLSNNHIDFLMQWRFKGSKYQRQKTYLPWKEYSQKHYEDVMRIALEKHPKAVVRYLKKVNNNESNKDFLLNFFISELPEKYISEITGDLTPTNLRNKNILLLALKMLSYSSF